MFLECFARDDHYLGPVGMSLAPSVVQMASHAIQKNNIGLPWHRAEKLPSCPHLRHTVCGLILPCFFQDPIDDVVLGWSGQGGNTVHIFCYLM